MRHVGPFNSGFLLFLGLNNGIFVNPTPTDASMATSIAAVGTAVNGSSVSTVYYAPVTITPSANCLSRTSFSYITMRALTGSLLSPLTSSLATITPWSVATIRGAQPTSASSNSGVLYVQVDVFLSQAPFTLAANGEESAWAKACYDPRNTLCPSDNIYGPDATGVSCIAGFPGASATKQTSAVATVVGPYKNSANRGSLQARNVDGKNRILFGFCLFVGVTTGLVLL